MSLLIAALVALLLALSGALTPAFAAGSAPGAPAPFSVLGLTGPPRAAVLGG
ncbi:MAG TPA: hypothetical protein VEZ42_00995 [Pseudonocardia sp.]|nr:hypothetical protein [Pseudonocardia sp.]